MNLVGKLNYPARRTHSGWPAEPHYSVGSVEFEWKIDRRFHLRDVFGIGLQIEEACDVELAIASMQQRRN